MSARCERNLLSINRMLTKREWRCRLRTPFKSWQFFQSVSQHREKKKKTEGLPFMISWISIISVMISLDVDSSTVLFSRCTVRSARIINPTNHLLFTYERSPWYCVHNLPLWFKYLPLILQCNPGHCKKSYVNGIRWKIIPTISITLTIFYNCY